MNSFNQNPMQMMMNLGKQNTNPLQQMMNMGMGVQIPQQYSNRPAEQPPIDRQKLKQAFSQFDEATLTQLVEQARMRGIPDDQIQQGLDFLLKMK